MQSSAEISADFSMVSVTEAVDLLRRRALSPVDLVQACLDRIDMWNSTFNAFSETFREEALAQARAAERDLAAGAAGERVLGPLHGVPIAVKDLFQVAGLRCNRGSRAYDGGVAERDSPIVERMRKAGAIILGKTTTTEFGWTAASTSPAFGPTRNPWNPALTSGGSSSGSGAAVAARLVPAALGSDGGGSVRVPAAFCGIFAMKGSLGRIPVWPWSATEVLSHAGPMTVTVADSALLFDVAKGPHPRDHVCLPDDGLSYLQELEKPLGDLKIAYAPSLFGVKVDPVIAEAVARAAKVFAQDLGCTVEQVDPDWEDPFDTFETIWVGGRGVAYGKLVAERRDQLDPDFTRLVEAAQDFELPRFLDAAKQRAAFSNAVQAFFEGYDFLLTPAVPVPPFAAEHGGPNSGPYAASDSPVAWARWTPFSYPFNLAGNPAASLPCGMAGGLPVGLQVIGRRFDDAGVLRLSAAFEAACPWRGQLPPTIASDNDNKEPAGSASAAAGN